MAIKGPLLNLRYLVVPHRFGVFHSFRYVSQSPRSLSAIIDDENWNFGARRTGILERVSTLTLAHVLHRGVRHCYCTIYIN